tara:strand:+ start:481 stop:705 length:225 start_codon:yes stop_codon:yes gene_type:complete
MAMAEDYRRGPIGRWGKRLFLFVIDALFFGVFVFIFRTRGRGFAGFPGFAQGLELQGAQPIIIVEIEIFEVSPA